MYPQSGGCWRDFIWDCYLGFFKYRFDCLPKQNYFGSNSWDQNFCRSEKQAMFPFLSSHIHWLTGRSDLFLLPFRGAMVLWRGYNSPADWWLQKEVIGGSLGVVQFWKEVIRCWQDFPALQLSELQNCSRFSPCNSASGGCTGRPKATVSQENMFICCTCTLLSASKVQYRILFVMF